MKYVQEWNKVLAAAKNVLGDSAKIPTAKIEVADGMTEAAGKIWDGVQENRKLLRKQIAEMQAAAASIKACVAAAEERLSDSDFGLDPKKPEDKKKIAHARVIFKKFFHAALQSHSERVKDLDAFEKKLDDLPTPSRPWTRG